LLENIWTEYLKEQLADRLVCYAPPDQNYQSLPDRWIAMSLLQKAVRRSDIHQALRAGWNLLQSDYRTLWRRIVVIAWEDVSFGDFDLCGMVTAASGSKHWRAKYGGEWLVASFVISALCQAQKNRVADDMITIAEHETSLMDMRDRLGTASIPDLQSLAYQVGGNFYHRTLATWYLLGTDKFESDFLYRRSSDVDRYFTGFSSHEPIEHVLAVCQVAVSRSGTILPALIPLLWNDWREYEEFTQAVSDYMEPSVSIRTIPRYAFDGNTRAGRRYLYGLVQKSTELKTYLHDVIDFSDRKALLRKLYFRSHSSLCASRQVWPISNEIRHHADQVGFGLDAKTIAEGKRILDAALFSHPMTEAHL